MEVCRDMYTSEGVNSGVSGEFNELACLLLNDADVQMPVSVDDAVSLYAKLMDTIDLMDNLIECIIDIVIKAANVCHCNPLNQLSY